MPRQPGAHWSLVAAYSHHQHTAWAINADGDTYGASNDRHGDPDLVAVIASNHKEGYAYADELDPPDPHFTSLAQAIAYHQKTAGKAPSHPVYTSDGHAVIGKFAMAPSTNDRSIPAPTTSERP